MVFVCLTSVGLPGLNGFVGEMLVLAGVFDLKGASVRGTSFAVVIAVGIVLGAWYLFTMLRKLLFGPPKEPHHEGHAIKDLTPREWGLLAPLVLLCVLLGVHPSDAVTGFDLYSAPFSLTPAGAGSHKPAFWRSIPAG